MYIRINVKVRIEAVT